MSLHDSSASYWTTKKGLPCDLSKMPEAITRWPLLVELQYWLSRLQHVRLLYRPSFRFLWNMRLLIFWNFWSICPGMPHFSWHSISVNVELDSRRSLGWRAAEPRTGRSDRALYQPSAKPAHFRNLAERPQSPQQAAHASLPHHRARGVRRHCNDGNLVEQRYRGLWTPGYLTGPPVVSEGPTHTRRWSGVRRPRPAQPDEAAWSGAERRGDTDRGAQDPAGRSDRNLLLQAGAGRGSSRKDDDRPADGDDSPPAPPDHRCRGLQPARHRVDRVYEVAGPGSSGSYAHQPARGQLPGQLHGIRLCSACLSAHSWR